MNFAAAERALWDSFGLTPTEQWLDLPTTRIRALVAGDGPTIVFVHGASNAASSWVSLAAQLPNFRCVMIDRPGCGLSQRLPAPLTAAGDLERFADSLLGDLLDALGLAKSYVVGTSFGGYFTLRGAAAAPERVSKLVTLGYSIGAPIERVPFVMRLGGSPTLRKLTLRVPVTKAMVRPLLKQIGLRDAVSSGTFTPVMVDWFHALLATNTLRNEVTMLPPIMTLRGLNDSILLSDELLMRVTSPTLMLWGRNDPFGGESTARDFAARIPSAILEMVDGGHAPWIDDAPGIAKSVTEFLTG